MTAESPKEVGVFMKKNISKRIASFFLSISLIVTLVPYSVAQDQLNYTNSNSEYAEKDGVRILKLGNCAFGERCKITGESQKGKLKIMVTKDQTTTWHDVEVKDGKFDKDLLLDEGLGEYEVTVMIKRSGRNYTYGPKIIIEKMELDRNLAPAKDIESDDERIINTAAEISKGAGTTREKSNKIYEWVASNIKYDYNKYLRHLKKDFSDKNGALNTLLTGQGMCYDYSTLFAALGRSQNIKVKVVKGYIYRGQARQLHAWNEIYLPEEGKWIDIDCTYRSSFKIDLFDTQSMYNDYLKIAEY